MDPMGQKVACLKNKAVIRSPFFQKNVGVAAENMRIQL